MSVVDAEVCYVPNPASDKADWEERIVSDTFTQLFPRWELYTKQGPAFVGYSFDASTERFHKNNKMLDKDSVKKRLITSVKLILPEGPDSFGTLGDQLDSVITRCTMYSCRTAYLQLKDVTEPVLVSIKDGAELGKDKWKLHSDNSEVNPDTIKSLLVAHVSPTDPHAKAYAQSLLDRKIATSRAQSLRVERDAPPSAPLSHGFPATGAPKADWKSFLNEASKTVGPVMPSIIKTGRTYVIKVRHMGAITAMECLATSPHSLQVTLGSGYTEVIAFPPADDIDVVGFEEKTGAKAVNPLLRKVYPGEIDPDDETTYANLMQSVEGQASLRSRLEIHYRTQYCPQRQSILNDLLAELGTAGPNWQQSSHAFNVRKYASRLRINFAAYKNGVAPHQLQERFDRENNLVPAEEVLAAKMKEELKKSGSFRGSSNSGKPGKNDKAKRGPPTSQCSHCFRFYHTSAKCFDKAAGRPQLPRPADAGTYEGKPVNIA